MNLYCIKCTKFTKHNNIKIKHEIDEKNLYSRCTECGFNEGSFNWSCTDRGCRDK